MSPTNKVRPDFDKRTRQIPAGPRSLTALDLHSTYIIRVALFGIGCTDQNIVCSSPSSAAICSSVPTLIRSPSHQPG